MKGVWRGIVAAVRRASVKPVVAAAYVAVAAAFLWNIGRFNLPGKGFTSFLSFGSHLESSRLSELRQIDLHVERASSGYDAQFYAQIAVDPSLRHAELPTAIDNLSYRARRILLPMVAYVLGGGRPAAILQAYALLNVIAWVLLALLLLHWFPPRSWSDFVRWSGVLLSFGLCLSVRSALPDGPSLLLIAAGVWLVSKGWIKASVFLLGASGLAKETNLLGAVMFLPKQDLRSVRLWAAAALRTLMVALPLVLWLLYVAWRVGPPMDPGLRNFDWPLEAYGRKWVEVGAMLPGASAAFPAPLWSLLLLIALTAQVVFLVSRPAWSDAWWRIGASFAVLFVFLGDAVWEGYPGAAPRVLLPMQVAFNVLVPRGGRWLPVLLLGNLTLFGAPSVLRAPPTEALRLNFGPGLEARSGDSGFGWHLSPEWYAPEHGASDFWSWTAGSATLIVRNPHSSPVRARLSFGLAAAQPRGFELRLNGDVRWRAAIVPPVSSSVSVENLILEPGENSFAFLTDEPAAPVAPDPRRLALCIRNLTLDLQLSAEGAAR